MSSTKLRIVKELMPIEFKELAGLELKLRKLRSEESELALRQRELALRMDSELVLRLKKL